MIELIASIVLLYAVVGSAAIWYRRAKARQIEQQAEQAEQDELAEQAKHGRDDAAPAAKGVS